MYGSDDAEEPSRDAASPKERKDDREDKRGDDRARGAPGRSLEAPLDTLKGVQCAVDQERDLLKNSSVLSCRNTLLAVHAAAGKRQVLDPAVALRRAREEGCRR